MDRPLDGGFVRGRRRRRWLVVTLGLGLFAVAFTWAPTLLRPTVRRDRVRTAVVDVGPIEAAVSAAGRVLPEVERVLTSPVEARVLRIVKHPGAAVKEGESIVLLDLSEAELAVGALDRDLALQRNEERRKRIALETKLSDVEGRYEAKKLELDAKSAQLERYRQLDAAGLVSVEARREAELAQAQAAIELRQLDDARRLAGESTEAEIEGVALEVSSLRERRAEAWRQLQRGTARADRAGVVSWTVSEEGTTVRKGEPIARLADLSAFQVEGTTSDVNASRLAPGLPVWVLVGDERLAGLVSAVDPTIRNGVVTFAVTLEEKSSPLLRPNLRVDVYVLTDRRPRALRLQRGPFATATGSGSVFVVEGDVARRRTVRLGVASPTHFEVERGLAEGDVVIVSDMTAYEHARELRLR